MEQTVKVKFGICSLKITNYQIRNFCQVFQSCYIEYLFSKLTTKIFLIFTPFNPNWQSDLFCLRRYDAYLSENCVIEIHATIEYSEYHIFHISISYNIILFKIKYFSLSIFLIIFLYFILELLTVGLSIFIL